MKLKTKVNILRRLGLFNSARDLYYRLSPAFKAQAEFYRRFIAKGDVCFDIGANIGQKVDVFLSIGAKVVAVEPQAECAAYLLKKYAGNARVIIEPVALDAKAGVGTIHINEANALSTMSSEWMEATRGNRRFQGLEWESRQEVKTETLDGLIAKHGVPRFCKIDVEGFELNVIRGLSQPVKYLSVECTPENLANLVTAIGHLEKLGEVKFQFCPWDNYRLTSAWEKAADFIKTLKAREASQLTGDIYACFA